MALTGDLPVLDAINLPLGGDLVLLCPGQCPALPELKQVARSCTVVHFKKKKSRSLLSENRNCDKFSSHSLHVDMYVYIMLKISFFLRLLLVKKKMIVLFKLKFSPYAQNFKALRNANFILF